MIIIYVLMFLIIPALSSRGVLPVAVSTTTSHQNKTISLPPELRVIESHLANRHIRAAGTLREHSILQTYGSYQSISTLANQ